MRSWALSVLNFLGLLFEKYKLVRRLIIAWACWIITTTIWRFFDDASTSSAAATVTVAVIGLLGIVIGFYQWSRDNDDD